MKKRIGLLALLLMLFLMVTACDNSQAQSKMLTVTFVQPGQTDVQVIVEEGEALTDIPQTKPCVGYTVVWENKDLTAIMSDLVVNAVETPNQYTVTYDPQGGGLDSLTQIVTYDAQYALASPKREGFTFTYWMNNENAITSTGKWIIADNITLTAVWAELPVTIFTVTFVQNGYPVVTREVNQGETLTDIPQPQAKTGYTVMWETVDYTNISQSFTVNALETAKEYTLTFDLGERKNDTFATISSNTQTVTYDSPYNLTVPVCNGYKFKSWKIAETDNIFANGTYQTDDNLTLIAQWEYDETSDRWWSNTY